MVLQPQDLREQLQRPFSGPEGSINSTQTSPNTYLLLQSTWIVRIIPGNALTMSCITCAGKSEFWPYTSFQASHLSVESAKIVKILLSLSHPESHLMSSMLIPRQM